MPKVSNCWNRARTKQSIINRFNQLEMAGSLPLQVMRLTNDFENRNELGWAQNPDPADWRVRSELKGEASMIKFNSCLVIIGLSIGLFFSHAATAAEAQQRDFRFQQNLEQLRQQQQIDQLQREQQQNQLQQRLDEIQRRPMGQIQRRQQSNDLQQQLDQFQNERQQKQLQQEQQLNQVRDQQRLNQPQRQQQLDQFRSEQQLQELQQQQQIDQLRGQQQKLRQQQPQLNR